MSPAAQFVITWPSRRGPMVRRFVDSRTFEGYVMAWKHAAGPQSATWLNPFTVQAHA